MRERRPPARDPSTILTGASFDDDDVDPRQRQLARQHQPRRTASGDHHRMLRHSHTPTGYVDNTRIRFPHSRRRWPASGDLAASTTTRSGGSVLVRRYCGPMTEISGSTRLVGILGWPVEHSLSPRMHNAAFAALGLDWAYVALPTPPDRLEDAVRGLVALGFAGANVTTPHKLAVTAFCETDEPSVNTLVVRDARIEGFTHGHGGSRRPSGRASRRPRRRRHRSGISPRTSARSPVLTPRHLAARRTRRRPDRQRDVRARRRSRRARHRIRRSSTSHIPRRPRLRPHAEPERASSAASTCCSHRASPRSSSGRALPRRWT